MDEEIRREARAAPGRPVAVATVFLGSSGSLSETSIVHDGEEEEAVERSLAVVETR